MNHICLNCWNELSEEMIYSMQWRMQIWIALKKLEKKNSGLQHAKPVQCYDQLSYEATGIGSRSILGL